MDDALRPAVDASYDAQLAREPMDDADVALAAKMIGRPLRGRSAAAVRCRWGLPAVLRVNPRLDDGTPFPTLFWLSCPLASKHVGRLEAEGAMVGLNERLAADERLAGAYVAAHERYVRARDRLGPPVPRDPSAGGMPGRVKCLHSLYAHHLATADNPIGEWVGEQVEPLACPAPCVGPTTRSRPVTGTDAAPRVAAVDVGTNSVRLLVASPGEPLRELHREMRVTRLGQGVDATGRLDDAALARTLDCLEEYADRWRSLGATSARVVATSAVRDAADRERFFTGAAERVGVRPVVLSGEEEARTAFTGATRSVTAEPPYLVLDIGGGSTELILGDGAPAALVSRQLGCVRLTESRLGGDPPTAAQLRAAREEVGRHLDAASERLDPSAARTLIGVAGTVTTLAALHLQLPRYEPKRIHGTRLAREHVRDLTRELAALPAADIAALGPMAPGREDVIVGGALILELVMERFGFADVLVSEADILDGLALELLAPHARADLPISPSSAP